MLSWQPSDGFLVLFGLTDSPVLKNKTDSDSSSDWG